MDETQSFSNTLPPFLLKTYEMVEDSSTDSIVSWSTTDKSFIVWNPPEFSRDLLPKFFKHNNFSSFIRQLNTYGFRKIDPEHWEFANDDFIRGSPHLLKNIHRRKPIHSHSPHIQQQGLCAQNCLTESERQGLQNKIERLNKDKESFLTEMQKHERESADVILQIQSLKERLQQSSQRHRNMESFLCQLLRPRLTFSFLSQVDIHDRKRRLPVGDCRGDEICEEEHQLVIPSQDIGGYMNTIPTILAPILELQESLDLSLSFWENVIEELCDSFFSEPFDLDESADDCMESPSISYVQLEIQSKAATIDMNCEPVSTSGHEPEFTSPKEESSVQPSFAAPVRFNDVFWEQFLTENPGSDDVQEAQSERRDHSRKTKEGDKVDYRRMWWGIRNVNNPAEQIGKLTPAGT